MLLKFKGIISKFGMFNYSFRFYINVKLTIHEVIVRLNNAYDRVSSIA